MDEQVPSVTGNFLARAWRAIIGADENQLVPQTRLSGPMPWVIAIMIALTVIAAAAGLALSNTAQAAADELSGGITIQIIEASPESRRRQSEAAAQRLRVTPGVINVRVISEEEVNRLIEPWLGTRGVEEEAVPVPALIDARLRDGVTGESLGAVRRTVREVAPSARVDAQSSWLKPVFGAIDSLQWLAVALVALLALATSAAVLLAVRNALEANHETIEVVHLLGGTDAQIARVFQRSIGFDAAAGGAVGLVLGLVVVMFFGQRFGELGAGLVNGGALGLLEWLLLALIPVFGVILAIITARLTVMRTLQRML